MSLCQVIVSDVVSLRERGKYQGILGAVVALANGVGKASSLVFLVLKSSTE
jgi:hypothetical protein